MKIYVAAVKALREKETQFTTKIDGFLSFIPGGAGPAPPSFMLMSFCAGFFLISPLFDQLSVLVLCFPYLTENSIVCNLYKSSMIKIKCCSMPLLFGHSLACGTLD